MQEIQKKYHKSKACTLLVRQESQAFIEKKNKHNIKSTAKEKERKKNKRGINYE